MQSKRSESGKVVLRLLTPQLSYLERKASQDETSLSRSFGDIIDQHASGMMFFNRKPAIQSPVHLVINMAHLAILDRLAVLSGLTRSDVARRLVDAAVTKERGDDRS